MLSEIGAYPMLDFLTREQAIQGPRCRAVSVPILGLDFSRQ